MTIPNINDSLNVDSDDDDDTKTGGQTGTIGFRLQDAYTVGPRDDALPPQERKRLVSVHASMHKLNVEKQKRLREARKAAKENKQIYATRDQAVLNSRGGNSGGRLSGFKKHPISVKFNGIRDQQVNILPSEYNAEINNELADKLEHRLANRLANRPTFNPKPRPF